MAALIPAVVLFLCFWILFGIRISRPKFAYHWLVAAIFAMIAWIGSLLTYKLPSSIIHLTFMGVTAPSSSNGYIFFFDKTVWIYSVALTTLLFCTFLTCTTRNGNSEQFRPTWDMLAGSILLTGFLLIVLSAGNLFTLLITWALADLCELLVWIFIVSPEKISKVMIHFFVRVASISILLYASTQVISDEVGVQIINIPISILPYLVVASALRLYIIPPFRPLTSEIVSNSSQEPILRFATGAPALLLLTRVANASDALPIVIVLFIPAIVASIAAGLSLWIASDNIWVFRRYWTVGTGALAIGAALSAEPAASVSFGLVFLLAGGLLIQYTVHSRWLSFILILASIGMFGLPLVLSLSGALSFLRTPFITFIFFIAQSLIFSGYFLNTLKIRNGNIGPERWILVLYGLGLLILCISLFSFLWIELFPELSTFPSGFNIFSFVPGIAFILISVLAVFLMLRFREEIQRYGFPFQRLFALDWLYHSLSKLVFPLQKLSTISIILMEGQAGILWGFMIFFLLLTIILQSRIGL